MKKEHELRILMVEDNKDDLRFIERVLQKDKLVFVHECVDKLEDFNEALFRFRPEIILSDHGMPEFNSFEALAICTKEYPDLPFILVTGAVSDEYAIACLKNGVDDYILKSNLSRLPTAIRNAVKKRNLEKQRREADVILRKGNDELVKVNKELDTFVYSVSHNLRGPLLSVVGLLNLADSVDNRAELDSLHGMMRTSISRLNDTLNDIIEYSRNSRNDVTHDYLDWPAIIKKVFSKIEYLHPSEPIPGSVILNTIIPIFSDAKRVEVILSNLLINAVTFRNKKTELIINIDVTNTDKSATIIIKDNGIGISNAVLPNIYKMFYRGTEASQGAGLGLYIVKEIVDKLKGQITITSPGGAGTIATLVIPNLQQRDEYRKVTSELNDYLPQTKKLQLTQ